MKNLGNVFILGDSYSTFKGYIPDEYHAYYSSEGRKETDVNAVSQTWWKMLLDETKANLVLNCRTAVRYPLLPVLTSLLRRASLRKTRLIPFLSLEERMTAGQTHPSASLSIAF